MMTKEIVAAIFIFVYFLLGCRTKIKYSINSHQSFPKEYEMTKIGEVAFKLDSLTTPDVLSLNYLDTYQDTTLSFYNSFTRYIYVYDEPNTKFIRKIYLEKDGVNAVGKVTGFYEHTADSIFVIDPWKGILFLVNSKGVKIDSVILNRFQSNKLIAPFPTILTESPMRFQDGKIFVTGSSMGENQSGNILKPVGISYKWHSDTPFYFMNFPEVYRNANWGGSAYRLIYTCFNNAGNMLFSFPADHNIYEFDVVTAKIKSYYAGSRNFDTISSFPTPRENKNRMLVNKHFSTTPSYSSLIYDKYRDYYYRMADMPIKSYMQGVKERTVKQFSIIILDNKFRVIGETLIPQLSHSRISYYVSNKGLNLRRYNKNDDQLAFSTFVPQKIVINK